MSSRLRAVVPAHIARKWNAIALLQLAEAVPQLDAMLEDLRRDKQFAEDCARMWQDSYDIVLNGGQPGLTPDGQIVRVGGPQR